MSGLISFCIFGDDPSDIYYGGAIENARLYREWHPDWTLRFYLGSSVPESVRRDIHKANPNTEFLYPEAPEDQTATYWRFLAIKDSWNHEFILFRDVDSRPCSREKQAVTEWLSQREFPYHMMRDHPFHGRHLMSGMWGIKREAFAEIGNHLPDRIHDDYYQTDQIALEFQVWPWCKRKVMVHIGCYQVFEKPSQRRPFRVPRDKDSFVGQGFYSDGSIRYPGHEALVIPDREIWGNPDIFDERYCDVKSLL